MYSVLTTLLGSSDPKPQTPTEGMVSVSKKEEK